MEGSFLTGSCQTVNLADVSGILLPLSDGCTNLKPFKLMDSIYEHIESQVFHVEGVPFAKEMIEYKSIFLFIEDNIGNRKRKLEIEKSGKIRSHLGNRIFF